MTTTVPTRKLNGLQIETMLRTEIELYAPDIDDDPEWLVHDRVTFPGKGPGTVVSIMGNGILNVRFDRDGSIVPIDPDGEVSLIEEDPPGFDPATETRLVSTDDITQHPTAILEACAAAYGIVSLTFDTATGWTLDLGDGKVVLRDHDLDALLGRALP